MSIVKAFLLAAVASARKALLLTVASLMDALAVRLFKCSRGISDSADVVRGKA